MCVKNHEKLSPPDFLKHSVESKQIVHKVGSLVMQVQLPVKPLLCEFSRNSYGATKCASPLKGDICLPQECMFGGVAGGEGVHFDSLKIPDI